MASFNDLIVSTLRKWSKTLADNVTNHSPLLAKLKELGGIVAEDGGVALEENIEAAENGTFKWYSGFETLDVTESDVLATALYDWKQANANVIMSGYEIRNNKGSQTKKYNLLAAKMKNAEHTMKNKVSASAYSDGTGEGGKELTGLQALVSDSPATSSVGGIDAAEKAFWRNQAYSFATDASVSAAPTPAQMLEAMEEMILRTTRNSDRPNLILASGDFYRAYKAACTSIKRISTESVKFGDASFAALEFEGIPVIYDANCPASHMYFLNCNYLKLRHHKDAYFTLDEERLPVNQDAKVFPMLFQGNLTCSNRNLQGVITA
ncbi:MAG: phage major capsid protein [Elusimicrobiaceae bacterium]|nr:phage major capsid protein [Elusimicrobiaceae bacterium]